MARERKPGEDSARKAVEQRVEDAYQAHRSAAIDKTLSPRERTDAIARTREALQNAQGYRDHALRTGDWSEALRMSDAKVFDGTLERGPVNVYMNKETGVHVVADKGGAFDIEGHPLGARQAPSGIEMAAAAKNPKARFHDSAAKQTDHVEFKPAKGLGRGAKKALGLLAPVAIGAAMLSAANEAKAEGTSQTKAAVKEGAKGAGTMALFVGGTAAATASLMKAGMTAAKAVPAVNVGMMAGNALLEAYAHRKDGGAGMAKAAAKGAWDMSLPGMAVNAGMAAKDAVQGRMAVTAPSTSAPASFQAASDRFQAMRAAAATSDPGEKKKGWSNAARIGAYKARMAKSGGSPTNLPYGGALTPPAPLKG